MRYINLRLSYLLTYLLDTPLMVWTVRCSWADAGSGRVSSVGRHVRRCVVVQRSTLHVQVSRRCHDHRQTRQWRPSQTRSGRALLQRQRTAVHLPLSEYEPRFMLKSRFKRHGVGDLKSGYDSVSYSKKIVWQLNSWNAGRCAFLWLKSKVLTCRPIYGCRME